MENCKKKEEYEQKLIDEQKKLEDLKRRKPKFIKRNLYQKY
jgi:hypothetical protein